MLRAPHLSVLPSNAQITSRNPADCAGPPSFRPTPLMLSYCNSWQKAPQAGIAQPYDVNEFYRF